MRLLTLSVSLMLVAMLAACDRSASAPTMPTSAISAFTGAWRTTTPTTGACTAMSWSITPTGATTATIAYTATCAGVPVTGTANGTLNGTTMNWTTTGTASAANCPFTLSGTAVASSATDLQVTYAGTVCGAAVSGADVLHR